ncbi:MAG TPA: ATP synthase F0 subunit B [Thermoanaerobaculia bacterium]|nr:ATP synthase F0 subunit B [Thermoanaerobaculia bacterium]
MQIDLKPDWSLLAIMAIFIANYFVVRRFFLEPVNRVLNEREGEIESAEAGYERALGRFQEATAEMEGRLQEARRRGSEVREARRNEAAAFRNGLLEKTRAEAEAMIASAEESLRNEVARARDTILGESDRLARLAAEKILGRKLA